MRSARRSTWAVAAENGKLSARRSTWAVAAVDCTFVAEYRQSPAAFSECLLSNPGSITVLPSLNEWQNRMHSPLTVTVPTTPFSRLPPENKVSAVVSNGVKV